MLERTRTGADREEMEACAAARDKMMRAHQRIAIRVGSDDLDAVYGSGVDIVCRSAQRPRPVRATFIHHAFERVGSQV